MEFIYIIYCEELHGFTVRKLSITCFTIFIIIPAEALVSLESFVVDVLPLPQDVLLLH